MTDPDAGASITESEFAEELAVMVREYRIWHTGLGALALFFCGLILLLGMFIGISALAAGGDASAMAMFGVVYAVMAMIYGIPAVLLLRSGIAAMSVFSGSDDREPILQSIRMQLWLWRVIGVGTIGITLMYILFFGLAFLGGMLAVL